MVHQQGDPEEGRERWTGLAAVRQAVEIILSVERFRWQVYRPYSGMQWEGLIGQDPGVCGVRISAGSPRP